MSLDLGLVESLLHQGEGASLDFKATQYPFENADLGQRAELLKDILAFANSWRQTTAYILIGVEEVKGERNRVVGVNNHLDDANLHQFVNEKTQRPVEFSYHEFQFEGHTIGVIEIPLQERPIHLKKRYGRLGEQEVFIRDGSSTRIAKPEEIAKMGAEHVISATPQLEPRFRIWLVDDDGSVVESLQTAYYLYEPMTDSDIRACIQSLKQEFPLATDFGSKETEVRLGRTVAEALMGMKYKYTPASQEDIAKYTEEEYPQWVKDCEEYLSGLHHLLQSQNGQPGFMFAIVNEGTRPGHDALISVIAEGNLTISPPPPEYETIEQDANKELSLPIPPQPPRGRWIPMSSSMASLESALSALKNPLSGLIFPPHLGITSPGLLAGIGGDNRRDPNAFYYKPTRSMTPKSSFSLECEQWRHGPEEEHFEGQLYFDLYGDSINGALTCEVQAENLSSPVRRTFPVEISVKTLNTADRARLLVNKLLSDTA